MKSIKTILHDSFFLLLPVFLLGLFFYTFFPLQRAEFIEFLTTRSFSYIFFTALLWCFYRLLWIAAIIGVLVLIVQLKENKPLQDPAFSKDRLPF